MHVPIVVVVLVVLLLLYAISRGNAASPGGYARPEARVGPLGGAPAGDRALAFVSRGKLFYCAPGEPQREIHSPHVQSVMDRLERSRQLHGWKQGTSLGMSFSRRAVRGAPCDEAPLQFRSAQFAGAGKLVYFLSDDRMGGLFEQDVATGAEKRLLHRQDLLLEDLRVSPDGTKLLCTHRSPSGTANVVMLDADGGNYRELTGGDTADTAPAWVPGRPDLVVLQSSGLARHESGVVVARGPASIQLLDAARGSLTPIVEDPRFDHLTPRVAPDGSLWFIRRPYESLRYGGGAALTDALLFPFRLLRALLHFLNFFSLMYSRKPLTSASGPPTEHDIKDILIQGKRIDAEAALRRGALVDGVRPLVPATWQLVRRAEDGSEAVVARHVASFVLGADGTVFYSTGYAVFALDRPGAPRLVLRDELVADFALG
jgi:hypothetical protein